MPLANSRITYLAAKHSSALFPATSLILEPCTAMSRPRVAMSILERKSAHPMMRVSPRSQPLPAARQPMHKGKHSTAETAALIKRARALLAKPVAIKVPALKPCIATLVLDRSIARKERISSATLKLKESLQPGKSQYTSSHLHLVTLIVYPHTQVTSLPLSSQFSPHLIILITLLLQPLVP